MAGLPGFPDKPNSPERIPSWEETRKGLKDVATTLVGETPAEWALTAATGPVGRVARTALLGAAALSQSPEAKAMNVRMLGYIPDRLKRMYDMASKLRKEGRGSEIWQETKGKLTHGPGGDIEAIYEPGDITTRGLEPGVRKKFGELADVPHLYQEFPSARKIPVEIADLGPSTRGRLNFDERTVTGAYDPKIQLREDLLHPANITDYAGVLGHEGTHTLDYYRGLPFGDSPKAVQHRIDKFLGEHKSPEIVSRDAQLRSKMLADLLRQPGAASDLYGRNLSEVRARAAQSGWKHGNVVDPYTSDLASGTFGRGSKVPVLADDPFSRLMMESSPTYTNDIAQALREMKLQR